LRISFTAAALSRRRCTDAFGNDIVVEGRGAIYVNDIGFKFPGGEFRPGVIVLVAPGGAVRKMAEDLAFPAKAAHLLLARPVRDQLARLRFYSLTQNGSWMYQARKAFRYSGEIRSLDRDAIERSWRSPSGAHSIGLMIRGNETE
jgi:hypothetical protein